MLIKTGKKKYIPRPCSFHPLNRLNGYFTSPNILKLMASTFRTNKIKR